MAIVGRKDSKGRKVYWVAFPTDERTVAGRRKLAWERVGYDKREAESLNRRREQEVRDGTFTRGLRPNMTFGEWLTHWSAKRTNRNAKEDRSQIARFLLSRGWLCRVACEDVRPTHTRQLVDELKATVSEETGKVISQKYVSNIYGLFTTACRDARIAELMFTDPCVLPKRGYLRRKSKRGVRVNYEIEDVVALSSCPLDKALVFVMMALLTGMREGEVCGRRWRDWDKHSMPLGCMSITTQYNDQPLKTEGDEGGEHPRKAPVHPALARLLQWWWDSGFEMTYCRKPTRDDFIVPRTKDGLKCHTKSSGYKLWRKACVLSGVTNHTLHSTRHTFLTLTQRGGARKVVAETITHNSSGDQVDHYTHWSWAPLCEAVLCFPLPLDKTLDRLSETPEKQALLRWRRRESKSAPPGLSHGILEHSESEPPPGTPSVFSSIPYPAVTACAGQATPTGAHPDTNASDRPSYDARRRCFYCAACGTHFDALKPVSGVVDCPKCEAPAREVGTKARPRTASVGASLVAP